jgi:hypothetical protein
MPDIETTAYEASRAAWKQAVAEDKFNRGFAEWVAEQPELPTVRELADAFRARDKAAQDLRLLLKPYAAIALGDWVNDDGAAHRNGRS